MQKTAILHDLFLYSWGWERLVTLLAKGINADLYTWFFNPDSLDPKSLWFIWKFKALSKPIIKQGFRHFKMMYIFRNNTKFLCKYDKVIFSWNCLEAVCNARKAKKIYYCHSPPRYLYDKYEHHLSQKKWIKKLLFKLIVPILRKKYLINLELVDLIIANSENVKERLLKYTWKKSIVIQPPVDTKNFIEWKSNWYYLSYWRLTDIKRIDFIAKAFIKMPDKKLVIIYNPSDPYLEVIQNICLNKKNIKLVKAKWNEIVKWVSKCRACIYIPKDEDFWMTPIESMSAWKPVLWVNEWWLKETIINWETWILLDPNFNIDDICNAVSNMDQKYCDNMKNACKKRAKEFDLSVFINRMKDQIS